MSSYTEYHRSYYLKHKDQIMAYNRELRALRKRMHLCRDCGKKDAYTIEKTTLGGAFFEEAP